MITLNAGACVRPLAKESSCTKCEVVCPTEAIQIGSHTLPSINYSLCVGCGACDAICPSEAISVDNFKPNEFFFEFLEDASDLISCKKNVPCIASLSVEHTISMAIFKKGLTFDMAHCKECTIAHKCEKQIRDVAKEASYILKAMGTEYKVDLRDVGYSSEATEQISNRREFFTHAKIEGIAKLKAEFEKEVQNATDELVKHSLSKSDIALLRKKRLPTKKKLLFSAIKRTPKPEFYHVIDASAISFTSMKLLDQETCTACQMCYRVCPTGALYSDLKNSKIDLDPFLCIKCHTCHDVCEPDSLSISPSYEMEQFFEPKVIGLIKFRVRRCDECNLFFSSNSDDKLCYRCRAEEDEARELWGIKEPY
ncbi:MAG: 4Fe-4S binding protein [Sulfuricurvum sp.]